MYSTGLHVCLPLMENTKRLPDKAISTVNVFLCKQIRKVSVPVKSKLKRKCQINNANADAADNGRCTTEEQAKTTQVHPTSRHVSTRQRRQANTVHINCTQQRLTAHFISKWIVISWPQCRPSKLKLSCPHNQCHLQHLSQLYILHIKRGCRLHRFGRTTSLWAALRGRSSVYLLKNLHNCGPVVYSLSWTIADRVKHFYKLWTVLSRPDWV